MLAGEEKLRLGIQTPTSRGKGRVFEKEPVSAGSAAQVGEMSPGEGGCDKQILLSILRS
jgi:hypothetical protein